MIALSEHNLYQYFSVVDTGHIDKANALDKSFNFINNNSDTLTVTVGDSWTWGADMTPRDDVNHRLTFNFGRVLSDQIGSDWLSLGQGGSGNFWLYQRVAELCYILPQLHYKKIYLICTLTEVGRAVNSTLDLHIDYVDFFKHKTPNELVEFLNQYVVDQLLSLVKIHPQVVLKIGTNFVDHIGISPGKHVLLNPWVKLCCEYQQIAYNDSVYVVSSWAIDAMHSLIDLVPVEKQNNFLQYMSDLIDLASARRQLLTRISGIRSAHPDQKNHKIWADYILTQLEE
jgi:hypothetical protein